MAAEDVGVGVGVDVALVAEVGAVVEVPVVAIVPPVPAPGAEVVEVAGAFTLNCVPVTTVTSAPSAT